MEAALSPRANNALTVASPATHNSDSQTARHSGQGEVAIRLVPTLAADLPVAGQDFLPRERSEIAGRILNVLVAGVGIILVSPLLMGIALLVRATSPGPILYWQTRVGVDRRYRRKSSHERRVDDQGGLPFTMYKFRTMQVDAEPDGLAVWAAKGDARVTPIGAALRRLRLDELPQLYNVLRGDMNIVGPRPERPSIFAELRREIPGYHMRQRVKPGITGWAQVNQAYDTSLDDVRNKVRLDLEYLERQGLVEDLRIMTMTVPVMLFRRGGW